MSESTGSQYQVLYRFAGGNDGATPTAGLVDVGADLYGTTSGGGTDGEGTVFRITTNGIERVLYRFQGSPDGGFPNASLLDLKGRFYGTTVNGGKYFNYSSSDFGGTVFRMNAGGKSKRVLHSFGSGSDGQEPFAGLIDLNGVLYGTTEFGGAYGAGTVFSVSMTGKERVLHSFGNGTDGKEPGANLIDVNGTLYSTTGGGGVYNAGTVFSITTGGKEHVLHSFGSGNDGNNPNAALIDVNGTLYGTTISGGSGGNYGGTVFSINTSGKEGVVYNFQGAYDGKGPYASLIYVNGTLYGTTDFGGQYMHGTVFSVTTGGKETVLHSFAGASDGNGPVAALLYANGTLYGTTWSGGSGCESSGCGTVYAIKP